jgi:germination protein M
LKTKSFILLILCFALCLLFGGCFSDKPADSGQNGSGSGRSPILQANDASSATVYYATRDNKWLLPLTLPIQATKEVAFVALEKLLAGPPNEFAAPLIPSETKLIDVFLTSSVVHVDLSEQFLTIHPSSVSLAAQAIAATVLPLSGVDKIQIFVNGRPCPDIGDFPLSLPFGSEPLNIINPEEREEEEENAAFTCYFSDDLSMYLVPQTYIVPGADISPGELATAALERLLQGPSAESGLFPTFWETAEINGCAITDDVAVVDFSASSINYGGGAAAEQMFLKSLVYSLVSIDGINSVQFLLDGEKLEYLPEGSDVSKPLKADKPLNEVF